MNQATIVIAETGKIGLPLMRQCGTAVAVAHAAGP